MNIPDKPIITLLTDFGTADGFVATMKGAILGITSEAAIVDIAHDINPHDIKAAAFILKSTYKYFPHGTIHVCIVDPDVGSPREILLVTTPKYIFIAPDNGLLGSVLQDEPISAVYRFSDKKNIVSELSNSFHSRDIFAPIASHLSNGIPVSEIAEPFEHARKVVFPDPVLEANCLKGEIIYEDRFGNLISNIRQNHLYGSGLKDYAILTINGTRIYGIKTSYNAVNEGEMVMLISSAGFLEIACYKGRASEQLKVKVGTEVEICLE